MKDGGEAGRRAEEAVLRHCVARGLVPSGRLDALRDEAHAAGRPLLALIARTVPPNALAELRGVHRSALEAAGGAPRPPLLRGDSSEGEAAWQEADTTLLRGESGEQWTGTERLAAPPPFAIAPAGLGADTVRDASTIPLPGSFDEKETVRDLPAVSASGDTVPRTEGGLPAADPRAAAVVTPPLARTRADLTGSQLGATPPAPGEVPVLIGPFPVQAELGRGRTGIVYRAWHAELARDVAIKVPLDPSQSERFLTAARAMARLRHPNIVMVHEVGEADGRPYIVTDLVVPGRSLAALIEAEAPLPPREAAQVARALALGLAEGHRRAVLHLALRPRNVLCAGRLEPVLTDFGLVTAPDVRDVIYVSPEQARVAPDLDRRADVYSLGVILYQLLTGELPYAGDDLMELLAAKRDKDATRPSKLAHGLDADIEAVCLRCLERDPADRYASTQDVAVDLANWLEGLPIRRPPLGRRASRWARRNPLVAVVAAVCVTGVLTVAVALTWVALTSG